VKNVILGIGIFALLAIGSAAHAATEWSAQEYDLYPGDFNGDGSTDILYIAKDPSKPSGIALADSTGAISIGWQTWASNFLGINWSGNNYKVIVADFNGDGKADIFLQSVGPGNNYLLLTSSAGFVVGISQTVPNSAMGLIWSADQHHIVAGDFNGDGHADLFLQATNSAGTDAVVFADANGMFTSASPAQTWTDGYLGFKWSTSNANVFAGDFDGNGRADLLIQAKPNIVMVDFDIPIPVPTYPPNMNGVVLSQGGTTPFTAVGVQAWSRMSNGVDWSPLTNNIVIGSNSSGKATVILQALHTGQTSYQLVGNATGAIFPATATALNSNVNLSADTFHLIAGNFGKSASTTGLYYQALTSVGTNYLTDSVGSTTTATAQNPTTDTGTVPALAVGRTVGTYGVSNTGNATYSIPIVVPPGVAGVQPKMAIAYQSGGPDGYLGVGWNLSGFSEIQRCKKTLLEDGVVGGPQLLATDDYCLDGNKLRLTGGAAYGQPGSTYQTEIDNFTQITAFSNGGNANLGPGYFVAQTKDGTSYEYGRTGGAYDNPLAPSEWLLDKVTDRAGNTMTITYSSNRSNGMGPEPQSINYGSSSVRFAYETRATTDIITRASMAGPFRSTDRIQSIQTYYNNVLVRQYNLTYKNTGLSANTRLSAVQECDPNGNCLLPTTISWQDGQSGLGPDNSINIGSLAKYAIPIDVNGDGRADVVYPSSSTGTWWIMLANASGGYSAAFDSKVAHNGNYARALAIDYNADGKVDLLVPAANNNWEILESTGTGFTVIPTSYPATGSGGLAWAADVNGDGLPDLVFVSTTLTQLQVRFNSATGFSSTINTLYTAPAGATFATGSTSSYYAFNYASNTQGDFNGDGRTDLLVGLNVAGVPTPKILISTGTSYVDSGYVFSDSVANGSSVVLSTWRAIDVNSDGFSDIAFADSSGVWKVAYGGPGTTAFSQTASSSVPMATGTATSGLAVIVADWDGDGRPDILWATVPPNTSGPWQWNRSTGDTLNVASGGTGSMTGPINTNVTTAQIQTAVVDVNGDGLADLAYGDANGNWHYQLHQGLFPDLVSSVADGFGNSVAFTYAPLTDSTVYTKGSGAVFPDLDVQAALYVVKQYTASDGIGGFYNVAESYSSARANFQGRGFEGFASRAETDSRTGITTTTTFNQSFPFIGLVATTTLAQSHTISQVVNSYTDLVTSSTLYSDRHYPYAGTVTRTTYEVNPGDPTDGEGIAEVTTVTTVDPFGTPLTITETTQDLTNNAAVVGTVAKSYGTPTNDVSNWCLGFVTNQTTTNTVPGLPAVTRTLQYVKDSNAAQCRVYQKIVEPNDPAPYASKLTYTYLYDSFGHVNNETIAGAGIANRVTQTSYGTQGVFPTMVTNAAGEVTQKSYNYALGVPLTLTDANGIILTWNYDSFARKNQELRPDNTYTTWTLYACGVTNAYCGDSRLRYQVQEQQYDNAGTLIHVAFQDFDSIGRLAYNEAQGLTGAFSFISTVYDNLGRVQQKSRPYFAGDAPYFTTTAYDILGRPLSETRQISQANAGSQSVLYSYQRLLHTYKDANGNLTQKVFNAVGQIVQVTDAISAVTTYQYDPFGNLLSTKDAAGNQVINTYNLRGFKTSTADPDMGSWSYSYYPTGEINSQKDAKTQSTTYTYDGVGRMLTRTEAEGITTWQYGNSSTYSTTNRNIAKLISVSSPGGYSEGYSYDSLGRAINVTTGVNGTSYVFTNSYDPKSGLLATITYPTSTSAVTNSRFAIQYDYQYGVLADIRDLYTPTTVYWQENSVDAAGHATNDQYGNGLQTFSSYDPVTGLLATRSTGTTSQIQNLSYQWDKVGNLLERKNSNPNLAQPLVEDFTSYDGLNRLVTSTLNGTPNLSLSYDAQGIGNIATKSDVGTYSYAAACGTIVHPHAVTTAGSNSYCYDANGNMVTRNGSSISWYSYNLPNQINQGSNYSQFSYGAGRNRYQHVSHEAAGGSLPAGTETTIYVSGMFEQVTKPSGVVEFKHYIVAGGMPIGIRTLRTNGVNDMRYLHRDHLGSVDTITNETGAIVEQLSYDAFGKRRSGATWSGTPSPTDWTNIAAITHRGFTNHEQLDDVGLVHMNGRVYDPTIGRFISADPSIQAPYMSQSLNRYSYVLNNPLSMMDPTGYSWLSAILGGWWDAIVGWVKTFGPLVVAYVAYSLGAPYFSNLLSSTTLAEGTITAEGAAVAGGLSAAIGSAASGGGWRGALKAGIWGAIGSWFGFELNVAANALDQAQSTIYPLGGQEGGVSIDGIGTPSGKWLFVNGIDNTVDQAEKYALQMSPSGNVDLFYNPDIGLTSGVGESALMKFSGQSSLGDQLADLFKTGDYVGVIGHSQGTVIISNALGKLADEGFTFDNGFSVTYYGSAANQYVAASLAQSVGATFNGPYNNFFDAVGNVVGLNTFNPFRIIGSILAFPLLFMGPKISPHDCYPVCAQ
jgi:RHS repeat-associated protein